MPKDKKFIHAAIKHPGALRRTAKRAGLVKGDMPMSASDIEKLKMMAKKRGDTTMMRRVNLAVTLRKIGRRKGKK